MKDRIKRVSFDDAEQICMEMRSVGFGESPDAIKTAGGWVVVAWKAGGKIGVLCNDGEILAVSPESILF